jgi:hypothetical protein
MLQKTMLGILISLVPAAMIAQSSETQPPPIADEEYAVYAAVIDAFHATKKSSHPIVADSTATFQCHANCNGMEVGGCNGLRHEDETPAERLAVVKRDLPHVQPAAIEDFEAKNRSCSTVDRKIPTKIKYLLSLHEGASLPDGWDKPDYFFFSRVGFDVDHTQALVVVGFFSGTDAHDSGGKYFLFARRAGKWELQGTSYLWQLL